MWRTPSPTSHRVNRLGKGSVGLPPRESSLSVTTPSGRVCHSVNPARSTSRTSVHCSLRQCFSV